MRAKIVLIYFIPYVIFMSVGCVPANRKLPAELLEVSGVARLPSGETYWINDGGNAATLYSGGLQSFPLGDFAIAKNNVDWEALTPYQDSLLCICDIGDNRRKRENIGLTIVNAKGEVLESRNFGIQ